MTAIQPPKYLMDPEPLPAAPETCSIHGGELRSDSPAGWPGHVLCQTNLVLLEVSDERARQYARYGSNDDLEFGFGAGTRWLLPFTPDSAASIERRVREDYELYEEETGKPTWVHLIREEVAEAFAEDDLARARAELLQVAALAVSCIEKIDVHQRAEGRESPGA